MTKYLSLSIALLVTVFSFAQTDITGKIETESVANHELSYALHRPENTKEKAFNYFSSWFWEKGTDIEKVKVHGPFKYLKNNDLDAYVLAPQCPENEYWDSEVLYQLILKIQKRMLLTLIEST